MLRPGDTVRCTDSGDLSWRHPLGDGRAIFTVESITGRYITLKEIPGRWDESHFMKYQGGNRLLFKKGDRVRCVVDTPHTELNSDDVYTVKNMSSDGLWVRLEEISDVWNPNIFKAVSDNVVHPLHYSRPGQLETKLKIRLFFGSEADSRSPYEYGCLFAALKYLDRYPHKGNPIEDLKKAQNFIGMIIEDIEQKGRVADGQQASSEE